MLRDTLEVTWAEVNSGRLQIAQEQFRKLRGTEINENLGEIEAVQNPGNTLGVIWMEEIIRGTFGGYRGSKEHQGSFIGVNQRYFNGYKGSQDDKGTYGVQGKYRILGHVRGCGVIQRIMDALGCTRAVHTVDRGHDRGFQGVKGPYRRQGAVQGVWMQYRGQGGSKRSMRVIQRTGWGTGLCRQYKVYEGRTGGSVRCMNTVQKIGGSRRCMRVIQKTGAVQSL